MLAILKGGESPYTYLRGKRKKKEKKRKGLLVLESDWNTGPRTYDDAQAASVELTDPREHRHRGAVFQHGGTATDCVPMATEKVRVSQRVALLDREEKIDRRPGAAHLSVMLVIQKNNNDITKNTIQIHKLPTQPTQLSEFHDIQ